ncbi:GntR family transcriptional regulator [Bacillus sp. DJP31]|uniref:GntR family transcriptional regulator n=1 Tax=Bacillus sp. DJP31 TaxID=3409789 RepID=UPI003BB65BBA
MTEEFQSSKPIYMQIFDRIVINIVRGHQKFGEKLPSVREMAVQMGVNPNTIQRTYSELERVNIVETRRGQGTFVVENPGLMEEMRHSLQTEVMATFVQKMEEVGISRDQMMIRLQQYLEGDQK